MAKLIRIHLIEDSFWRRTLFKIQFEALLVMKVGYNSRSWLD